MIGKNKGSVSRDNPILPILEIFKIFGKLLSKSRKTPLILFFLEFINDFYRKTHPDPPGKSDRYMYQKSFLAWVMQETRQTNTQSYSYPNNTMAK